MEPPITTKQIRTVHPTQLGNRELMAGLDRSFPSGRNPHFESVEPDHLLWMREYQLVAHDDGVAPYLAMQVHWLGALAWPRAGRDGMKLAADFMGFIFVCDDQFDLHPEHPVEKVRGYVDTLLTVFGPNTDIHDSPGVQALVDLRNRWNSGMPEHWIKRCDNHFHAYLEAVYSARVARRAEYVPPEEEVTDIRLGTVCFRPCLDLIERMGGFALPEELAAHPAFESMNRLVALHVCLVNDIFSVDRETFTAQQIDNVVLPHVVGEKTSLTNAKLCARDLANQTICKYIRTKRRLSDVYNSIGLSADDRTNAARYIQGVEDWMMGHIDWYVDSSRGLKLTLEEVCPSHVFFGSADL